MFKFENGVLEIIVSQGDWDLEYLEIDPRKEEIRALYFIEGMDEPRVDGMQNVDNGSLRRIVKKLFCAYRHSHDDVVEYTESLWLDTIEA